MRKYKIYGLISGLMLVACTENNVVYDASGVFETTDVIVSAQGNGTILQLKVEEGQEVDSLMLLGVIDTTQLHLTKKQLLASQKANKSRILDDNQQLASIKQQIANLQRERERFQSLLDANATTQKQVDDIEYQITVLEKQKAASAEQINNANASINNQSISITEQVTQIDKKIKDCIITSPIKGTVLTKYAETGEFATAGRALFKVANMVDMKLRAYVSADKITTLKIGQKVKIYADLGESERKEFDGVVSWISSEAEFTPKTIQTRDERSNLIYAIKVSVKNDGTIKRGMYGDLKF